MGDAARLIPAERRGRILELLHTMGSVRVADLCKAMDVSELTIRRDLDALEQEQLLERTHGGAILSQRLRIEPLYTAKHQTFPEEKQRIGAAAATLVEDGETVFINSGSTTINIFPHLIGRKVRVITSNAGAVTTCQGTDIDLTLIGGSYRAQSHSLVGPLARASLRHLYASKCFIGVDGISRKYGLTTPNAEEAEIARMMIRRTHGQVVVVADHSKLGCVADCVVTSLQYVDVLVVDAGLTRDIGRSWRRPGSA